MKGQVKLPSKDVMLEDSKLKASRKRDAHKIKDAGKYLDELANLGGFDPLPEYYKSGYEIWIDFMESHLDNFKDYTFVVGDDKATVEILNL